MNQFLNLSQITRFPVLIIIMHVSLSVSAQLNISSGRVDRYENFPSQYVATRTVDVWLPADYDPAKKYNVLYMHDGQMLFDSTFTWNKKEWGVDEMMGKLQAEGNIPGCIVVGIWSIYQLRHADYFPEKAFNTMEPAEKKLFSDWKDANGNPYFFKGVPESDNYLKFIVDEVKPFIDANYSVYTDKAHTYIMGSSMGGLISMYAICEYPEIFGGAACLSTHWTGLYFEKNNPVPDQLLHYLKTHIPSPKDHMLYFDHGTETLDAMYGEFQEQADAICKKAGYTAKNYLSKIYPGASHTEDAWHARLDVPLIFLMGIK